ncbi:TPA: hypothetical protein OUL50_002000 [Clostridioides difficile]|nr:hypothetical protein [Clostridioides difficile]HBF9262907.1 hypothetical protein [Clostridioides difficile]HBG1536256.1 hypothetical protein [Clostridioides difficile]HCU2754302.1 hypothetical protein [Clostridioides difficile]
MNNNIARGKTRKIDIGSSGLILISGIFLFIVQGLGSTIDYIMYKKIRGGSKRKNKYVPWGLFLI